MFKHARSAAAAFGRGWSLGQSLITAASVMYDHDNSARAHELKGFIENSPDARS
jgi:hypothetical protein